MKIIKLFNQISEYAGRVAAWMTGLLVLLVFFDVLTRYLFNFTLIWMVELEIYLFALIFLLASGYAFKHEQHVRVDVFYAKKSKKGKAWVDLLGGLFLLLPWTFVAIIVCYNYFLTSWTFGESSSQPGGLPALYILKFAVCLGFILLFIQGVSSVLNSYLIISNSSKDD